MRYDAIVVGSGLGGLAAAARLLQEGQKVLVLEQSPHPGGTAYSFIRKGYRFPMGPLGFSSPETVKSALSSLGVKWKDGLELERVRYRVMAYGLDLPISAPFDRLRSEITDKFPEEAEGVARFFNEIEEIAAAFKRPDHGPSRAVLEEGAATSAANKLEALIRDPRLIRVLGGIGTGEPYSSMNLLAAMWDLMANQGIWVPAGGMWLLCDRLAKIVAELGGDLEVARTVQQIDVSDGRVGGVTLASGEVFKAGRVISNADFKTTFLSLVDPMQVSEEWFQAVFHAKQTSSNLQVNLGVDVKALDLSAFDNADRVLYRREFEEQDLDWKAPELDPEAFAGREIEISLVGGREAGGGGAPENGASILLRTEAEYGHFAKYRPVRGRRLSPYLPYKTRLAEAMVGEAGRLLPGLADAAVVMDVSTPLTFEERGGRSAGSVAGWSWDFGESDSRARELVLTPVEGLYMAGYQAYSSLFMGGVPTAVQSGLRAARAALMGEGPSNKVAVPGARDRE